MVRLPETHIFIRPYIIIIYSSNLTSYWPPDKSAHWKTIFFISHPKHML